MRTISAKKISQEACDFISQSGGEVVHNENGYVATIPADWKSESKSVIIWRNHGTKTYYYPPNDASIQVVVYPPIDADPSEILLYRKALDPSVR